MGKLLTSQQRLRVIINKINSLSERIKYDASTGLTDIHKLSEGLVMELINLIYGYNLQNLNKKANHPGVDLGDPIQQIAFQVTSVNTLQKIKHTLHTCEKYKIYEKYKSIKIFILGVKDPKVKIRWSESFQFDSKFDVWDFAHLFKEIKNLQTDRQKLIYDLIVREIDFDIPKDITTIPQATTFIGRVTDLQQSKELLLKNGNILLVNGIGGVGKTTIAKKIVSDLQINYLIKHVVWLTVSNTVKMALTSNTSIIENLKLSESVQSEFYKTGSFENIFDLIVNRLRTLLFADFNLMVIDNVHRADSQALNTIARLQNYGWKIILTSREEIDEFKSYSLDILSEDEAIMLFTEHYKLEFDKDLLVKISRILGYHTLMIEIIALTAQFYEWRLFDLVQKMEAKGFNFRETNIQIPHSQQMTVLDVDRYITKIFSLVKVNDGERSVLRQISVLPIKSYSLSELYEILNIDKKNDDFSNSFKTLVIKGWIQQRSSNKESRVYSIHHIVASVAHSQLSPSLINLQQLVKSITKKLFIDYENGENPLTKTDYINYAEAIWPFLSETETDLDLLIAELAKRQCIYYWAVGNTIKALEHGNICVKIKSKYLPSNHIELGDMYNNLGLIYLQNGEPDKALYFALMDKELLEDQLPSDDPILAISYSNLCNIYHKSKAHMDALKCGERAISIQEKKLSVNQQADLAISYKNTALVCKSIFKETRDTTYLEKALTYANSAYNIRKNLLDKNHPYMASIYFTLALIHYEGGEYTKANTEVKKSIKIYKKIYPNGHIDLAETLSLQKVIKQNL